MESLLLYGIKPEEFFEKLRSIIKEELKNELQKDQLLTKEGALKMTGVSNATFIKAINDGIVKPQLVKGRKKAMLSNASFENCSSGSKSEVPMSVVMAVVNSFISARSSFCINSLLDSKKKLNDQKLPKTWEISWYV